MSSHCMRACLVLVAIIGLATFGRIAIAQDDAPAPPVKVTIDNEKAVVIQPVLPVLPGKFIQLYPQQNMQFRIQVDNRTVHLGYIMTQLKIDNQTFPPGSPQGRMVMTNAPLPKKPGGKPREGHMSVYEVNKIVITQTVEIIATKPSPKPKVGEKRRLDAVLVRYTIENKDSRAHEVGLRVAMDMYLATNDGALFAAPTMPNKVLNGLELKGKDVPSYLKVLERPDLKNPGYFAHFTYSFGRAFEMPTRVVVTQHGRQYTPWDIQAVQSVGDSAMGFFWDPVKIAPGGKRQFAYSYGKGIGGSPENEGAVALRFNGSFEPGKMFTIKAYVTDPQPGQSLRLELPKEMQLLEGGTLEPVPPPDANGFTMLMWKARVLKLGTHTMRIRSSSGVTHARRITIERPTTK